MKKTITCCILIISLFVLCIPTFAFEMQTDTVTTSSLPVQCISLIESELSKKNTNVVLGLEGFRSELMRKLESVYDEEEREKIVSLVEATTSNINQYNQYIRNRGEGISPYGTYDPTYSTATLAIISYFSANEYYLAAELLTHAMENDILDSEYTPVYGYRVTFSPVYQSIKSNNQNYGSGDFESSEDTILQDLYYGIHLFNYTKNTNTRVISISDRYDYTSSDYSSITGVAVQTMYYAQILGVIVPFYTQIDIWY